MRQRVSWPWLVVSVRVNGFPCLSKKERPQPTVEVYPFLAAATLTLLPPPSSLLTLQWPAGPSTCPEKGHFVHLPSSRKIIPQKWLVMNGLSCYKETPLWLQIFSKSEYSIETFSLLKLQQPFFFHKLIFPCSATQKGMRCCCIFGDTGSYQEADCYPLVGFHLLKTARMKLSK